MSEPAPEGRPVSLRLDLLEDDVTRARRLAQAAEMEEAEALRLVFAAGLAALEQDLARGGPEFEGKRLLDMPTTEERERFLLARLQQLDSQYSVMKFKTFHALKDNQTLKMNVTGLRTENQALLSMHSWLRKDNDALRSRVKSYEEIVTPISTPPDVRGRWRRVLDCLKEALR